MAANDKKKFEEFEETLKRLKEEKKVLTLYRGLSHKMAFDLFNLDKKHNTVEQFGERLFFFGDKAKHFWNYSIKEKRWEEIRLPYYDLNNLSRDLFDYIFTRFNHAFRTALNNNLPAIRADKTRLKFIEKNRETSNYFLNKENRVPFLDKIDTLPKEEKEEIKEHYLVILHQFGDSIHSNRSYFVSSSKNSKTAENYAKGGILIHTWDCDVKQSTTRLPSQSMLPTFIGKPFKNDKEISFFTCIFPQYIHSFTPI